MPFYIMGTLIELSRRLKIYAKHKAIEIELFKFLKENPNLILQYNKRQLFEDSIGADGIDLGFYSYNTVKYNKFKKGGEPFTMIESAQFRDGLTAKVLFRKVIITSDTPDLEDILLNPVFITTDFFGLTDENLILLKRFHTTNHIREWLRQNLLQR